MQTTTHTPATMVLKAIILIVTLLLCPSSGYTTIDDASISYFLAQSGYFRALVDVRTPEEWADGHLPNATFLPSMHETGDTSRLEGCEDCPLAIYCRSGRRSKLAADVLEEAGFTNVYDVLGVRQWTEAGIELVAEEERDPSCCEASCPASGGTSGASGWTVVTGMVALVAMLVAAI